MVRAKKQVNEHKTPARNGYSNVSDLFANVYAKAGAWGVILAAATLMFYDLRNNYVSRLDRQTELLEKQLGMQHETQRTQERILSELLSRPNKQP